LVRGPPSFEGKDASLAVKAEFKTVELLPGRLFACYQFVKNSNRSRNERNAGSRTVNNTDIRKADGLCGQCPGGSGPDHSLQKEY
jgi:hypothetical protein